MTLALRYTARSDVGLVRGNNEDSVYAGARLLALADGMGGHAAGEVASQLVIAALAPLDDDEPGGDLLGKLHDAVREGNSAIADHVEQDPELDGMGTTLTAILFDGNRLGLVHVGDSRGYLLRDGELAQITKDDTFVQTLVDEGRLTLEEAHSHPQRSLIMRALTGHEIEPTLIMREARSGDRYLLCSDGLSDPVSGETILEALQIPDVTQCADRLIELALRGGGPDNVTVVVADVIEDDCGQTQPILGGAVSGGDTQLTRPNTAAGRASAINPRKSVAQRILPQIEAFPRPARSKRRLIIAAVLLVLLLLAGLMLGWKVIRGSYYVTAHNGSVAIMRGIQQSILGVPLQETYLVGCLSERNDLSLVGHGQAPAQSGCHPMTLHDLRPYARAQVAAGLPTGTLDEAYAQMRRLALDALLPPCRATPPGPESQPRSPSPSPTPDTKTAAPGGSSEHASPTAPAPTPAPPVTASPPPPSEPGTDCRTAA